MPELNCSANSKPQMTASDPDSEPQKYPIHTNQVRVLLALKDCRGALTRVRTSEKTGSSSIYVGKSVGRSDPDARAKFENSRDGGFRPSLLTLGYVEEVVLDIDGVKEVAVRITRLGREFLASLGEIDLPPLRSEQDGDDEQD